ARFWARSENWTNSMTNYATHHVLEQKTSNGKLWSERLAGVPTQTKYHAYTLMESLRLERPRPNPRLRGESPPPVPAGTSHPPLPPDRASGDCDDRGFRTSPRCRGGGERSCPTGSGSITDDHVLCQ